MTTITEVLTVEHRVLCELFRHVESLANDAESVAEIGRWAALLERLLRNHADTENSLAYAALDHTLAQRGRLKQLFQDHHEIDAALRRVPEARTPAQARRLLARALQASRDHFRHEEEQVFPLMQSTLREETLGRLGQTRLAAPLAA
ncbi:MAG: hemerythrin domain-containing protein [Verrucomicrobiota bacterium]